jgi:hypothetical protein
MFRNRVERRLSDVSSRQRRLRDELAVLDEQRAHMADDAEDARLRALVSETPIAQQAHRDAARHVAALDRRRQEILVELAALEELQDKLLDELTAR